MGRGWLSLQPLTNGGRETGEGTGTGRETDSKPGGSDDIPLLAGRGGGRSSSAASATGGGTEAGPGALAPSWPSRGTSERDEHAEISVACPQSSHV